MSRVRYCVTATVHNKENLNEYIDWLKSGHVQAVIAGGALNVEILLIDTDSEASFAKVESSYIFESRATLQAYFDGPAIELRKEGIELFINTGKVSFERKIADVIFTA